LVRLTRGVHNVRQRQKDALAIPDADERRKELTFTAISESRQKLDATLSIARSDPSIADAGTNRDTDRWLWESEMASSISGPARSATGGAADEQADRRRSLRVSHESCRGIRAIPVYADAGSR
jgi:hypothetical protein